MHYAAGINSDPLVSTTARRHHYIHPALSASRDLDLEKYASNRYITGEGLLG